MTNQPLEVAAEVREALAAGRPVVALESTVITHGLPHPANLATAGAMEAAVRAGGAVPATIAVLSGRPTIGLTAAQLERLAGLPAGRVRKCSRRDLPIAAALGEDAATTVAGTMILAHAAGIRVLATGGIGGVHRGQPFDVSADLLELGRTPVAVVCSGAKSILDLPLTLEVLETQGVPVLGLATDWLPGFYTRRTALGVDANLPDAGAVARVIAAAGRLGACHGIVVAVPVPEAEALPEAAMEAAIARAIAEADAGGVRGKHLTPFLLGRVAELTGGASRRANIALLLNNGRVGGEIAAALARLD